MCMDRNVPDLNKYLLVMKVWWCSYFITSSMIIQGIFKREPGQGQMQGKESRAVLCREGRNDVASQCPARSSSSSLSLLLSLSSSSLVPNTLFYHNVVFHCILTLVLLILPTYAFFFLFFLFSSVILYFLLFLSSHQLFTKAGARFLSPANWQRLA